MTHLLIPCRMNLRSITVLLYFACLKKLAEAHFGHERGVELESGVKMPGFISGLEGLQAVDLAKYVRGQIL